MRNCKPAAVNHRCHSFCLLYFLLLIFFSITIMLNVTNLISSLAFNLIIFTGGFHTRIKRIKPVMVA